MKPRQQVLRCLELCPAGLTDRQIASTLDMPIRAARMHRWHLMQSGRVKWYGETVPTTYVKKGREIDGPPAKVWTIVRLTAEMRQAAIAEGMRRCVK